MKIARKYRVSVTARRLLHVQMQNNQKHLNTNYFLKKVIIFQTNIEFLHNCQNTAIYYTARYNLNLKDLQHRKGTVIDLDLIKFTDSIS